MTALGRFATAINCMDGRTQDPVSQYLKSTYDVDFVDQITYPGPDTVFFENKPSDWAWSHIMTCIQISVEKHKSIVIALVGHEDCAGNPVSQIDHETMIMKSIHTLSNVLTYTLPIIGLWIPLKDKESVKVLTISK